VLLDQERPVPPPGRRAGAEVTEVPGEDCGFASFAHGHDGCVGQVDADAHVLVHEVERMRMLCVRGSVEVVRAIEECTSEHDRRRVMASRAKPQMDFDVHWPGWITRRPKTARSRAANSCRRRSARLHAETRGPVSQTISR
jgi:hypothetical protein